LTGKAVKVTAVPEHTGFTEAEIETLTGSELVETIVIVLEKTGFGPVIQLALDRREQVIKSPFDGI